MDEIIVADSLTVRTNHGHQVVDFIVTQPEIQLGKSLAEFSAANNTITRQVENLECSLEVQILEVK
jgi:hypothetical protein